MLDAGHPSFIVSLELALLRALCASAEVCASRDQIASAIPGYKWRDSEHAIVYEALCKVPNRDKRPLSEQLPVIATRMGFPDVEWEAYFVPPAVPNPEILELLRMLASTAAHRP
jgi:hypothetical protein